jgi:hypothetical protein
MAGVRAIHGGAARRTTWRRALVCALLAGTACHALVRGGASELPARPTQTAGELLESLQHDSLPVVVFGGVIRGAAARIDSLPNEQPIVVEHVKGTGCPPGTAGCDAGFDVRLVSTCADVRARARRSGRKVPAWCATDPLPKCNEAMGRSWIRSRPAATASERLRRAGRGALVVRVLSDDWLQVRGIRQVSIDLPALGVMAGGVSDSSGQLALDSLVAGTHELRVRAIGFERLTVPVTVRAGFADTVLVAIRTQELRLECPGRRAARVERTLEWSRTPSLETAADRLTRLSPAVDSVRTPVVIGRLLDGYWQEPRGLPSHRMTVRPVVGQARCRGRGAEATTDGRGEFVIPSQVQRVPFRLDRASLAICEASPGDEPSIVWINMGGVAPLPRDAADTLWVECNTDPDGAPCVALGREAFIARRRPDRGVSYDFERVISELAGCYRITVEGWTADRPFAMTPGPRVFELTPELYAVDSIGARFYRARQLSGPSYAPWAPGRRPIWTADPSTERVSVHIYDDESGISIQVWQEDWNENGVAVVWARNAPMDTTRWPPYGFAHGVARGERLLCR